MADAIVTCRECNGTGRKPEHKQKDGRCLWCNGKGKHPNVPYPMFCMDTIKCLGKGSCPRPISCCD